MTLNASDLTSPVTLAGPLTSLSCGFPMCKAERDSQGWRVKKDGVSKPPCMSPQASGLIPPEVTGFWVPSVSNRGSGSG